MAKRIRRPFWPYAAVAVLVVVADQLTKAWAESSLAGGAMRPLLGHALYLKLVYNPGTALSLGSNSTLLISIIAIAAVVVLPFAAVRTRGLTRASVALIWAGAAGNLIDRLTNTPGVLRGEVVDFIGYGSWFVGNVADIALVLGVVMLVISAFTEGSHE
ncbi:signal peptidase II [Neoactinobaculum massilliense]|uniref:signal peptidase II n=1 Tax=Neoactinobaculum massilliense TaxID=2364794 RepID=UPI000F51BABA|nr:signal peptidase II [Neoactinobaculum massilliense]